MRIFAALMGLVVVMTIWSARSAFYYRYGLHEYRKGNLHKSVELFSRTLSIDAGFKPAYDGRGCARYMLGETTEAEKDFTAAIDLDPGYAAAYCHRGMLRLEQGDEERGLFDLNKALDFSNDYAEPHFFLGLFSEKKDSLNAAEMHYTSAIEIAPEDNRPLQHRAAVRWKKSDIEGAREDWKAACRYGSAEACESLAAPGEPAEATPPATI